MKKTILALMLAVVPFIYSCSSDDDSGEEPQKTNKEKLADGGIWLLNRVEVTEILDPAGSTKTKAEFSQELTDAYEGLAWEFSENGSGTLTLPGFGVYDFTYTIVGNDTGQDNFVVEFDNSPAGRFVKTKVNSERLSYEWDVFAATEDPDNDAEVRATFIFD